VRVLLDGGADVNFIDDGISARIDARPFPSPGTKINSIVKHLGVELVEECEITVEGETVRSWVAQNLVVALVIGVPGLKTIKCVVNYGMGLISVGAHTKRLCGWRGDPHPVSLPK